ncbi:MAG TPA: DUF4339 domain-containing protein [Candidatus Angelobacter sp.]|nr:DUF4339 domain-containing protein [Candidatus Angelobacter sp.]
MKYYIQRQLNEYGPYTLADLQRYVAQGNILLTDLARSEGMTEWVPVSQVLGNIPMPAQAAPTPQPTGTVYGSAGTEGTMYGGTGMAYNAGQPAMPMANTPVPTDLHWALVLLIGIFTCGLFNYVWLIIEAAYVKKIKPESKGLLFIILAIASGFFGGFMGGLLNTMHRAAGPNPLGGILSIGSIVLYLIAVFQMKSDLEDYYNRVEPIHLQLSGVMTFFFAVYYFQHHFSRIAQWKKTGVLQPQG